MLTILAVLLLTVTLTPFLAMKHVTFDAHGFHPLDPRMSDSLPLEPSSSSSTSEREGDDARKMRKILPADCVAMLADESIWDPNKELEKDSTKRLTITDPKFYISLHSEHL